jgi:hypothetical protein
MEARVMTDRGPAYVTRFDAFDERSVKSAYEMGSPTLPGSSRFCASSKFLASISAVMLVGSLLVILVGRLVG